MITTLARGGAQATVLTSSDRRRLASHPGVEVAVWAGPDDTGEGSFRHDPIVERVELAIVPDLVRSIDPRRDLRALVWLVRQLRAERPDVLHTHSSKAGLLGRLAAALAGVRCVHTVHGWGPILASRGPIRSAVVVLERALARLCAALVVVGRGDLGFGLDHGVGRPDQYRLIRSGVDLPTGGDRHQRDRVRAELGLDARFVVGMVGRMAGQKDQATLIEAFGQAALDDATLLLVGDGPRRAQLESLARVRPDCDIRFLGARSDGARLVAGFDVAVNASRWEGLPRTVVEAMANRVPVVAADVGGTSELIRSGRTGWLVRPGDPAQLAEALVHVQADPARARAMAAEAAGTVGAFSTEQMVDELVQLWATVAGIDPTDARGVADRSARRTGRRRRARRNRRDRIQPVVGWRS